MEPVLGNVVALAGEARALLGRRNWKRKDGWPFRRSRLSDGTSFISVQSGMGLENAYAAASWLASQKVSALMVMGVSGGLNPNLGFGDIILADSILEEKDAALPDTWKTDIACTDLAYDALNLAGISVHRGAIISAAQPLLTQDPKKTLYQKSDALAVDMESSAIARVSKDSGIPLFVMRVVSDPADTAVHRALFDCMGANGAVKWRKLLGMLLRGSLSIHGLVKRGREYHSALKILKQGWQHLVESGLPNRIVHR